MPADPGADVRTVPRLVDLDTPGLFRPRKLGLLTEGTRTPVPAMGHDVGGTPSPVGRRGPHDSSHHLPTCSR